MSKSHVKHMSAEAADKFEENLEGTGENEFGTLEDWEMELGLQILKIESKLATPVGQANVPVNNMLTRKLVTYNAALQLLDQNPKMAATIGDRGGLQAIIAYITKAAIEDVARAEVREFSNMIMPHLAGYRLSRETKVASGLMNKKNGERAYAGASNVPKVDGSKILQ